MMKPSTTIWIALLTLASTGCTSAPGSEGPNLNSKTNWLLACSSSIDCPDQTDCYCGSCTRPCDGAGDCSALEAAECVGGGVTCGSAPAAVCMPGCESDSECGEGYRCAESLNASVCVPGWTDSDLLGCPSGLRYQCGETLGGSRGVLFECSAGSFTQIETCTERCVGSTTQDAFCAGPCEQGQPRCGTGGPGGYVDSLYSCPEVGLTWLADCIGGCDRACLPADGELPEAPP